VAPFQHVALEDVQPLLLPQIDAGMFKFDAQDAESALQSLPWVYKARVRRIWPGTLQVELWEQKVVARWGSQGLLNPLGEVFVAQEDEGDTLPMLDGPENSSTRVWRAFRQCQEQLSMSDLRLTKLVVDRRGSWRATLSEGTEIRLGQGIPLAAIKIFLDKAFPVLREQMAGIAVVDVRYPNGFAVGRRAPDQQIDQTM
jgi:cell division protein FtsQ